MIPKYVLNMNLSRAFLRFYSETVSRNQAFASTHLPPQAQVKADVPGLSSAIIRPAAEPVGPGVDPNKGGAYKVPEYYCYNNMSYFEAEIEMSRFRCPQPSSLKK